LAARAPYFHDGTGFTLVDVLHSYQLRFNIGFTTREKTDITNFLHAL
jgi:hypothetical protein